MKDEYFNRLWQNQIVLLDGATGTELAKRGLPPGCSPELWCLEHSDAVVDIRDAYMHSGSNIVYVPSFGANRVKLANFCTEEKTVEINRSLARISRTGNPENILIFGNLAPTGVLLEPLGQLSFDELVDIYIEQAASLIAGGVDGFAVETMYDLQEARAAAIAVRECAPNLPLLLTMTFDSSGRTMTGNTPESSLLALQELNIDAFGCNCSTGPEAMKPIIEKLKPLASIPLIAKPNAGMPRLNEHGESVFDLSPEDFARQCAELAEVGANFLGGCCGTSPKHIQALHRAVGKLAPRLPSGESAKIISSSRRTLADPSKAVIIPLLDRQIELKDIDTLGDTALDKMADGAEILRLDIEEAAIVSSVINAVTELCELPLAFKTNSPETMAKIRRYYPGKPFFVN